MPLAGEGNSSNNGRMGMSGNNTACQFRTAAALGIALLAWVAIEPAWGQPANPRKAKPVTLQRLFSTPNRKHAEDHFNYRVPTSVFNPRSDQLASVYVSDTSAGFKLELLSLPEGKVQTEFDIPDQYNYGLAFSPDYTRIAYGTAKKGVILRNLTTGEVVAELAGDGKAQSYVSWVAFNDDGTRLAVRVTDSARVSDVDFKRVDSLRVWDSRTGKQLRSINTDVKKGESTLSLSPDWALLAVGDLETGFTIRDFETGQVKQTLAVNLPPAPGARNYPPRPTRAGNGVFSPDGRRLATRSNAGTGVGPNHLVVWDVASGTILHNFSPRSMWDFAWSPDGRYIATGSDCVQVWDVQTGVELARGNVEANYSVHGVAFSPDGTKLVGNMWWRHTVNGDSAGSYRSVAVNQKVTVWDLTPLNAKKPDAKRPGK